MDFPPCRPVVGARAEFDLYHRADVTGDSCGKYRWIMKEEALAVACVRVYFEMPAGFTKVLLKLRRQCRHEHGLNPLLAGFFKHIQALPALCGGRSLVRSCIPAKAEKLLVHNKVNVLGKSLNKPPCL